MRRFPRKTTPRVVNGKTQRKNRAAKTPTYYNTPQDVPVIERQRPGPGHRHLLRKQHIIDFISILPDWDELSRGLNAILLATAEPDIDGWHDNGIVAVCAWERELHCRVQPWFYHEHHDLFARLGVPCHKAGERYLCKFTEDTARAYQLLHILLHELGHHHDRMTTRSRRQASRGESYAERYANSYEKLIWGRYGEVFER